MRTAVVHDWLTVYAGAEKVLEQILRLVPNADVFAVVDYLPQQHRAFLGDRMVNTSFIQRMPFAAKRYRQYLPLMPLAVEQFDLSKYDLVISSSHAVAKGVITGPYQAHICYCHSPIRYAWDLQHQYLAESGLTKGLKGAVARAILHYLRMWDVRTANGVDCFVANSTFVARRILKAYRRESRVVFPPVDLESFQLETHKEDFYLTASRMVPYKKIDLLVEAFTQLPDRQLVVIGDGPDFEKIRRKAGPNVQMLGYQSDEVLIGHMRRAKAFLFAAEEDFGIVPVEAQACGTPVIGYGRGGLTDTVIPGQTGVFFNEQTVKQVVRAVKHFEACEFDYQLIRRHAEKFGVERFKEELRTVLEAVAPGSTQS